MTVDSTGNKTSNTFPPHLQLQNGGSLIILTAGEKSCSDTQKSLFFVVFFKLFFFV
uniref:Uncharacterized protein n=1 Tax=Anguilla anguilla TaxID=7936 RepID=A0A0E9R219_ANGAN